MPFLQELWRVFWLYGNLDSQELLKLFWSSWICQNFLISLLNHQQVYDWIPSRRWGIAPLSPVKGGKSVKVIYILKTQKVHSCLTTKYITLTFFFLGNQGSSNIYGNLIFLVRVQVFFWCLQVLEIYFLATAHLDSDLLEETDPDARCASCSRNLWLVCTNQLGMGLAMTSAHRLYWWEGQWWAMSARKARRLRCRLALLRPHWNRADNPELSWQTNMLFILTGLCVTGFCITHFSTVPLTTDALFLSCGFPSRLLQLCGGFVK